MPTIDEVKQWDIWHVYWDHGDGTGKERPAVAVSTGEQNAKNGYVTFLKITGEDHPEVPCRLLIDPRDSHFPHTGLHKKSWIHILDAQNIPEAGLRQKNGTVSPLTAIWVGKQLRGLGG
jgi:mRNA-degrading endonuclease toxin of MazEF toxin-antitoxin module